MVIKKNDFFFTSIHFTYYTIMLRSYKDWSLRSLVTLLPGESSLKGDMIFKSEQDYIVIN